MYVPVSEYTYACHAQGGKKRASDPLELELQTSFSCHEGATLPKAGNTLKRNE